MSAIHPRPDQVAALTRGQTLPLPPLFETTLRTVAEALVHAWNDLATAHAEILRNGDEPEITSLLEIRLNALIEENVCWETLVRNVTRGRECLSYNGSHLEKRPDLSIHLTCRRPDFPLVVECKLIDHPRRKTVDLYCREGIKRFMDGEYAWMCAEAFMLAYVRDGSTIATTLIPRLATDAACAVLGLSTALPCGGDFARSRHERCFTYLGTNGPPGPIALWHVWLDTPAT
jgi:hypothetical protein